MSAHIPKHLAIIMDGNGRWAQARGLTRSEGHTAGAEAVRRIIRNCRKIGIPFLTLYTFSSQNWDRPPEEVKTLMKLLLDCIYKDCEELVAEGVRIVSNGDIDRLPAPVRQGLAELIEKSKANTGLTLCLALSYGGREEIVSGVANACRAAIAGDLDPAQLTPAMFRSFMPCPDMPDPDLVIRTSGEMRISNFLLWQIAYSEIYVTDVLWPDFDESHLLDAIHSYNRRERRFGKTSEQIQNKISM
jgi:undecaprenyl diphosphate synthase